MNLNTYWSNVLDMSDYFYQNPIKIFYVAVLSVLSFLLFLSLSAPFYTIDILLGGQVGFGFGELYWLLKESSGILGVILVGIYSILFGVVLTISYTQIRRYNRGFKNTLSVIPAIIFSGCAGCGTGVIAVLSAAGITSILPFGGNFLRLVGIILMIVLLIYIGDPRKDE